MTAATRQHLLWAPYTRICELPAARLTELAHALAAGPLRAAIVDELALRAGSDADRDGRLADALADLAAEATP